MSSPEVASRRLGESLDLHALDFIQIMTAIIHTYIVTAPFSPFLPDPVTNCTLYHSRQIVQQHY
jgi:hypothetical protein